MLRNLVQMSSNVSRHRVLVRGYPTEILCVGQSIQETPQNVILFIPGNPGIAAYYTSVIQELHTLLGGSHAVWSISHAGHCLTLPSLHPGMENVYNYEDQIKHKIAFIEDHISKDTNITLVGHSIGCSIILHLLKHFENRDVKISHSYLMFPAIERIKASPSGRKVWPFLLFLRWLVILFVWFASYLPERVRETMIKLYFWHDVAECNVTATKELIQGRVVQNVLWMAYHELQEVLDLDVATLTKNKDKVLLYYGAQDGWAPRNYYEEMKARVSGVNAVLCEDGIQHAYVLRHSKPIAEKLAKWIKL